MNTKRKENVVAEAMANLKTEYSRMVLISEIYPTPQMEMYIATVYKLGIEFLQDAAIYYSRPTLREYTTIQGSAQVDNVASLQSGLGRPSASPRFCSTGRSTRSPPPWHK